MAELEPFEDPAHIDRCIYHCITKLKELNSDYYNANQAAASSEAEYNIEFAAARIAVRHDPPEEIKITEGVIDDTALAQCEDQYRAYKLDKAKADAIKQATLSVRAQLDGFRSLAANHRELSS